MSRIDRSSKVLLALVAVGVWGLLLRPLFSPSPAPAEQPKRVIQSFDEINVGRVNIVAPDGKRRLILSHEAMSAPVGGKELKRSVPPGFAAIVFCNPNGDEVGGIGFGGTEKDSRSLIGLDYTGVPLEAIGFSRRKAGDKESASFVVADTPRRERIDMPKLFDELHSAKPGPQVKELQEQMVTRIDMGVENRDAALRLYDRHGRPRVVIQVDAKDRPRIEVLDEKGKAVARLPSE